MLGIGAVIGAGIFSSIGTAAVGEVAADGTVIRAGAGPALILSFVLLGVVCALAGLCYAELTAMIPIAGSAYTYAYATLGELVAWIIGWDLILEYAVGNIAVAIAWSDYFTSLLRVFGIEIPFWLCHSYRDVTHSYPEQLGELPLRPRPSHRFQRPRHRHRRRHHLGAGHRRQGERPRQQRDGGAQARGARPVRRRGRMFYIEPANWQPFAPNGWNGIHQGAAIVFFAYIGFDAVSTAAEETKDPQRNMPAASCGSLAICTVIYVIVGAVATGIVPYTAAARAPIRWRAPSRSPGVRLGPGHHRAGRGHLDDRGAARLPARPAAHLLLDEPRRPAAALVPPAPPEVTARHTSPPS